MQQLFQLIFVVRKRMNGFITTVLNLDESGTGAVVVAGLTPDRVFEEIRPQVKMPDQHLNSVCRYMVFTIQPVSYSVMMTVGYLRQIGLT